MAVATNLGLAPTNAAIGVLLVVAGPAARILSPRPNATNGASSVTRREAGVTDFDCGAGDVLLRRYPTARWSRFYQLNAPGVPPLSSARATLRGGKAQGHDANPRQSGGT
jgi:hypothetical protein